MNYNILVVCCTLVILGFSGCVVTINIQDNNATVEMVKAGADPIKAKCAIRPQDSLPVCVLASAK